MAGLLDSFRAGGAGILNSIGDEFTKEKVMAFLASPEATALAAGFSGAPSVSAGLGQGMKNISEIEKERMKHPGSGMGSTFGKALSDYNAILNAYGPDSEYTKLAKQNLENISAGSQGLSFEFDPVTGAYTLGMGGTAKGSKGGPMVSGEGTDKMIRTPPTQATTTDVQKQLIAKRRAEIVNPHLEHPYVGSGTNVELANDILKYKQNPTPELREKLVKLATAEKLVSFSANLNLLAEGGSTGESATRRQEQSVRQGWAEGASLALKNMPKDIIEEAKRRADEIKNNVSRASETEYASGFAIDLPRGEEQKQKPQLKAVPRGAAPKVFPTKEAGSYYLKTLGVSDQKMAEIAKKRGMSIQDLANQVYAEQNK